jgi:hypothetical protein
VHLGPKLARPSSWPTGPCAGSPRPVEQGAPVAALANRFRRAESPRPVREDGEQHKRVAGIPFGVEAGLVGAHQSLSMMVCAAKGEPAATAHAGGRGGRCPGQRAAQCQRVAHEGNSGAIPWPEVTAPMRPSMVVVNRMPRVWLTCRLDVTMKTPSMVRCVDDDDSWAAAAVAEGTAVGSS